MVEDPEIYRMWKEGEKGEITEIPEQLKKILTECLPIREKEKNKFGEVFTPPSLIEYMLDKLAVYDKDVWTNPKGTFLDPAAGICNFAMVAYFKLMKDLSEAIPDDRKRSEHIIRNMLFNVEINPDNVTIARRIFGKNANIACGSSLEGAWVEGPNGPTWKAGSEEKKAGSEKKKPVKFGVVMGNPPYNKEGESGARRQAIWANFIAKAHYETLSRNGFLLFVHPRNWRGVDEALIKRETETISARSMLTQLMTLRYLEMHDNVSARSTFAGVSLPGYDWYVAQIQSWRPGVLTAICDVDGTLGSHNLADYAIIPSGMLSVANMIVSLDGRDAIGDGLLYQGNQFHHTKPWIVEPTSSKVGNVVKNTTLEGVEFWHTTDLDPTVRNKIDMFGVSKVIFGDGSQASAFFDDGKFAMSENALAIASNERDGKQIAQALRSPAFASFVNRYYKFQGGYRVTWKMMRLFRKDFYKAFLPGGAIHKLYEEGKLKAPADRACGYVPPTKSSPSS